MICKPFLDNIFKQAKFKLFQILLSNINDPIWY